MMKETFAFLTGAWIAVSIGAVVIAGMQPSRAPFNPDKIKELLDSIPAIESERKPVSKPVPKHDCTVQETKCEMI